MANQFAPKQALAFDGALLEELQGDVSEAIAREVVKLVPTITSGQKIHDNGCGYGAVTAEILATDPPSDIEITATDKSAIYLKALDAKVAAGGWPVKTAVVDANDLTFPDETFDLSISDFVILGLDNEVGALKHVWRTLKPGGTGAISAWKEKPWQDAMRKAHYATRGKDAPIPPFLAITDWTPEQFRNVIAEAGWEKVTFTDMDAWVKMKDLKRWATIAWTFLSKPSEGWTQVDEDNWDKAIDVLVDELGKSEAHKKEGDVHLARMTATIAVATKE